MKIGLTEARIQVIVIIIRDCLKRRPNESVCVRTRAARDGEERQNLNIHRPDANFAIQ